MKQRITYFVQQGTQLDLKDIYVKPDGVNYSASQPPFVEKRVIASLSELPEEVGAQYSHLFQLVSGCRLIQLSCVMFSIKSMSCISGGHHV